MFYSDIIFFIFRRSLKRGESVRYLIPDSVIDYIQKHNLYQVISIMNIHTASNEAPIACLRGQFDLPLQYKIIKN